MKIFKPLILLFLTLTILVACKDVFCIKKDWYEDLDKDGLGNPKVSQKACRIPAGFVSNNLDTDDTKNDGKKLHLAFADFDKDNFSIALDGETVVIESNGLPNHPSPYWSNINSYYHKPPDRDSFWIEGAEQNHPLFVEPTVTSFRDMAPGYIDEFNGSYSLTVSAKPTKAATPSSTGMGPIGIAVSGAMIYNDREGPNLPLDDAAPSLDFNGAHTGPQSYHYHLEPKAWTNDDDQLVGIISDGFFLYGRKCNSTGSYPNDLDVSGGHTSTTQHSSKAEYHYHIQNEMYLNLYYILFPGDYQGTPNHIL